MKFNVSIGKAKEVKEAATEKIVEAIPEEQDRQALMFGAAVVITSVGLGILIGHKIGWHMGNKAGYALGYGSGYTKGQLETYRALMLMGH